MAGEAHKIKNKTPPLSSKSGSLKLNRAVFLVPWQDSTITIMVADSDLPKVNAQYFIEKVNAFENEVFDIGLSMVSFWPFTLPYRI
jgi:hypothetical protein